VAAGVNVTAMEQDRAFLEDSRRGDAFDGMRGGVSGAGRAPGVPAPSLGRQKTASSGSSRPPTLLFFLLPWLMFVLLMMLFTYGYHHIPGLVWSTVCLLACFALIFVFSSPMDAGGRSAVSLGVLCGSAIVLGVLGGLHNYGNHMEQYWLYEEAREYHNVLPSEPAAAHADAGKITFAEAARIDTTKAVGYKAASTYCVAPILDPSSSNRVEFWAVGLDCCAPRGEFNCDDATKEGTEAAHGGLVVFNTGSGSLATSEYRHYEYFSKAVKESEAANDLVSSAEPIFVRWVKDPESVQNSFFGAGNWAVIGYCVLHGAANAGLAWLAHILRFMGTR